MLYEEQSTNWVDEHRECFFDIHAESDHVELISNKYTDYCYELADEYMIDNSDLFLVSGTTSNCYVTFYAMRRGVKIDNFNTYSEKY